MPGLDARPEVHVGDLGTLYRARVWDEDVPFDPSSALIKQLIFRLPNHDVITKNATVVDDGLSPPTAWYLTYMIQAGDGLGSPPQEFHLEPGPMKIQAFLEWADGTHFHSDVRTTDDQGRELRIYRNLD
jgi:hypothetical protein